MNNIVKNAIAANAAEKKSTTNSLDYHGPLVKGYYDITRPYIKKEADLSIDLVKAIDELRKVILKYRDEARSKAQSAAEEKEFVAFMNREYRDAGWRRDNAVRA